MKYMQGVLILFGVTWIGELLNKLLPFPIPSGVYGLFILLILLCGGVVKLKQIEPVGSFLLDIMPMLFIPASVGLITAFAELQTILFPLFVISIVSTLLVMTVTGKVSEFMMKKGGNSDE